MHALKTPVSHGGWGASLPAIEQSRRVEVNKPPPTTIVHRLYIFGFNFIFIPVPTGVDHKGSETQVAQACVIALRLWQKFPLAK